MARHNKLWRTKWNRSQCSNVITRATPRFACLYLVVFTLRPCNSKRTPKQLIDNTALCFLAVFNQDSWNIRPKLRTLSMAYFYTSRTLCNDITRTLFCYRHRTWLGHHLGHYPMTLLGHYPMTLLRHYLELLHSVTLFSYTFACLHINHGKPLLIFISEKAVSYVDDLDACTLFLLLILLALCVVFSTSCRQFL